MKLKYPEPETKNKLKKKKKTTESESIIVRGILNGGLASRNTIAEY